MKPTYEVVTTYENQGQRDVVEGGYQSTYLYPGSGIRVQHVKFLGKVEKP